MQLSIHSGAENCVMLSLTLTNDEIDDLAADLIALKTSPQQHFHLTRSDHQYVDIEISAQTSGEGNAVAFGFAIEPGTPPTNPARRPGIASAAEYAKAQEELRHLTARLERLQQASQPGEKGLTKAGVRKMIARLHEELAVYEGESELHFPTAT